MLSGFGATINYTYAPSDSANVDVLGKTLPIQDNSEESANAILWYDKDGFQFRLAGNYRSARLDRLRKGFAADTLQDYSASNELNNIPVFTDSTIYVDVSASYDISEQASVYIQGSNITEEFENQYSQWKDNVTTQNVFESRWTVGVRGRF
jgi:outer membrane receptor protein involved in Fe transport